MNKNRTGAMSAIGGAIMLLVGTYLHPLGADPNDALAAFSEYAADHWWITSHLLQLVGVVLMVVALLFLARELDCAGKNGWSPIAAGGAIASLGVTAVLQAVDGIALKAMADAWASAPTAQKEVAFQAALAVRQIEIGLASMGNLLFGLTVVCYGMALLVDDTYPKWMAGLAMVGGVVTMIAGVIMAYSGFSGAAMVITMPANVLLLGWMLSLGVLMWRRDRVRPDDSVT